MKKYPAGLLLREELMSRAKTCGSCGHITMYSQKEFALSADLPERVVSEIINGKRKITPYTAKKIAKVLGTSAEMWLNIQHDYEMSRLTNPQ